MRSHLSRRWNALLERFRKRRSDPSGDSAAPDLKVTGWLQIAPGVQVSGDDRGLAFLDLSTGRIFVGNQIAGLIWLSASKGLSIDKTAEEIAARFEAPRDLVERDIRVFVEGLERNGLAVRRGAKP
jgi:hypothetical protein